MQSVRTFWDSIGHTFSCLLGIGGNIVLLPLLLYIWLTPVSETGLTLSVAEFIAVMMAQALLFTGFVLTLCDFVRRKFLWGLVGLTLCSLPIGLMFNAF